MSEQAQASTTTGAAARSTPRTRPSRARPSRARANSTARPKPEAAKTVQQGPEARTEGEGADRYEASRAAAAEEARQQEGSVRLETERQEHEAREAEAREASEKEAARVRQLMATYQTYMNAASARLDHTVDAVAEMIAILTWEPSHLGEVEQAIEKAARGLSDFRTYLANASSLGAEPYMQAPNADLGTVWTETLAVNREFRRRVDAHISVMETDMGNVPALLALERSIHEQGLRSTVMARVLGRLMVREKIAR